MRKFPAGSGPIFPWWPPPGRSSGWRASELADPVKLRPDSRDILEITVTPTNPDTARIWEILRRVRGG